jgi:hypothetical protein
MQSENINGSIPNEPKRPATDAQKNANRENAQHSTGPSEAGKAKSSMNAVKTGLTGRSVLLPTDDVEVYQQHIARIMRDLAPATDRERAVVQTICDTEWRLLRIAPLESAILAIGRREQQHMIQDEPEENKEAFLLGYIFSLYKKDFTNIALQERRLRNQRKEDLLELKTLQDERLAKEKAEREHLKNEMKRADRIVDGARTYKIQFDFAEFGFVFTKEEYDAYRTHNNTYTLLTGTSMDVELFLKSFREDQKAA